MMDVKVLGDRVLVALPPEEDHITASGILLVRDPDVLRTPTRGVVVQLGIKSATVDLDEVLALLAQVSSVDGALTAVEVTGLRHDLKRLGPAAFDVEMGDCVIFPPTVGDQFKRDGIDYVILREAEILGVVEPLQKASAA